MPTNGENTNGARHIEIHQNFGANDGQNTGQNHDASQNAGTYQDIGVQQNFGARRGRAWPYILGIVVTVAGATVVMALARWGICGCGTKKDCTDCKKPVRKEYVKPDDDSRKEIPVYDVSLKPEVNVDVKNGDHSNTTVIINNGSGKQTIKQESTPKPEPKTNPQPKPKPEPKPEPKNPCKEVKEKTSSSITVTGSPEQVMMLLKERGYGQ